ncbi:M15 family metallopeptidase [Deinococcus actinosclerus]|uniref:M15 family metallopeptidase n=1 Tax=Deinococcus actinosclerus TaxID=1768108 RepID=UPI0012FBA568|nr:M15 family metallopeptidase [Deinococcus actinosclerus]
MQRRAVWAWVLGAGLGWASALTPAESAAAQRLVAAYPAFLRGVEGGALVWRDGTRMPLTRSAATTYPGRLDAPGLLDQLDAAYPACAPVAPPAYLSDPGRVRFEPLLRKMYGASEAAVRANLVTVDWFGQPLRVTRVNGAADSLRAVAKELTAHPEWRAFLTPSAGTFLWRAVAGTPRRSVHSFGAAIDLNTTRATYWQWSGFHEGQRGIPWHNQFPAGLVHTFERRGWIWGGRWYHLDTMHFEYRPELTGACAAGR